MPLRLLYNPDDKAGNVARVDIIAVHGLNPRSVPEADHAWDTWRKPSGDKGRLWLRDDLPRYAPSARIFLYQYNSKLVYGGDKAGFIDKANDLLEALRIERKKDENRPLIFLAHSLGGILVRQALVNAHCNPTYNKICTSTKCLAFFGTPHGGGNERLVALGAATARIASALHVQPSNDLVETLKKGSLFSDLLAEQWRHHLESYQLVSFWEGIGDIIPKKSATFGLSGSRENVVRLEATHSDLCRFDEHDQDNSKLVLNNIEDLYEHAVSPSGRGEDREAIAWVSRIPYEQHHNTNKSEVLQGTGLWLFEEKVFAKWKQEDRSTILWLHGIPGCGKTKLVSLVVEKQRAVLDKRQGLAFFYCNRNDAERERADPESILRSIVRQLSMSGPRARIFGVVAAKYTERKDKYFVDGPLRLDECVHLIIELTKQYTSTTIIIDALDECDVSTRHGLLAALRSIVHHGLLTKIFVSSRDDKDITLQLSDLPNLYIKASNNAKDIAQYVHFKVGQAVADRRLLDGNVSVETIQLIRNTLSGKAQGMFLWVTLQLQNLCSLRLNVEEDLLEELGRLPQDLADTYAQIFEHVKRLGAQSRIIADRSLKWLLCQARELSEAEFLAAVSMGTEREFLNLTKDTILFLCGNLVMFDRELRVFRFAHLSVREYLETQSKFTPGAAHTLCAEMSLLVCLNKYTKLAAKHACKFRQYAILYWLYHCREAKKSGLGGPLHQLLKLFLQVQERTNLCYAAWARSMYRLKCLGAMRSHDRSVESDDKLITRTLTRWQSGTIAWIPSSRLAKKDQAEDMILDIILGDRYCPYDPTFAACFLDLPDIVEQNLQSALSNPEQNQRSVLCSPAMNVEELASCSTKVFERRNVYGETYMHVACHRGSSELLRLLLQYPIPIRASDHLRRTALHYAVHPRTLVSFQSARWTEIVHDALDPANAAERVAIVGLLIEKGSVIDAVDCYGQTALHRTIDGNRCNEAQFLVEHGAFVDAKASKHADLLLTASQSRHTAVIHLLLQSKVNIEVRDSDGMTPLLLAAQLGHTGVTHLLLQFKANVEARDSDGMTPLLLAAQSGHTTITRLLLQSKADIEARCPHKRTPLLLAAKSGHTALTRLLLQSMADIEARDCDERTPLFQTVVKGDINTARLLLHFGANINAKDSCNETPLARSLLMRQETMAYMLIDESASTRELDLTGNMALHYAAVCGLRVMVSNLLKKGANINETNVDGFTPLHLAIAPKCASLNIRRGIDSPFHIVQCLVDAGANIDISDDGGRTALHLAARMADMASIQILLDRDANIKAEDKEDRLPLDHAAASRSLNIFSLLFMRWSDVMAESGEDAVESWLRLATRKPRVFGGDVLQNWRSLSFKGLTDLTSNCEVQKKWANETPRFFISWLRARQVRLKFQ